MLYREKKADPTWELGAGSLFFYPSKLIANRLQEELYHAVVQIA